MAIKESQMRTAREWWWVLFASDVLEDAKIPKLNISSAFVVSTSTPSTLVAHHSY
jgi:hypothetical protein